MFDFLMVQLQMTKLTSQIMSVFKRLLKFLLSRVLDQCEKGIGSKIFHDICTDTIVYRLQRKRDHGYNDIYMIDC
jgi:hypothetical protein